MFSSDEITVVILSLKVALLSTLLTIPLAIFLGWILATKKFTGKILIEGLINIPLVAPPVVTGYLLLVLLGKNGIVGHWLYSAFGIQLAFNFAALLIASMVVSLPLAVRNIKSSFELVDPDFARASGSLGASKISTFFRIYIPMALPGILSGAVLVFARSLGEFGATISFAGNIFGKTQTIALMVYSNMQIPGKELQVTRLVVFSIAISLLAIIASEYLQKKKKYLVR
ncbi:MAG: molybdenum ABC transporter permease subunit [Bacteroidetes bacterium GWC2_33_15]|nr:MAG: molybdenum ABC transporter permease subunit [Bacteroidetes bacterium GWA2_33_15]OFX50556.1 MAG: molybdenum ABC transporter permease subunit [Bacteroidetes bacterium GWC2_33_15]OFX64093.1 MAG: molybdenum ABC transporter permease subunit [Bacteroidetes bacterium GWB2_32_14]OFX69705.1 MAG: molybdenum ABC transporter permease subunit [Bacteroidetes bacterium GWD2_33_33]HAN19737.1 molybdate ABC transporter permease subunit [Bacteroidales bacterium]